MSRYYIGTAGWSYEDWEGVVYPEKKEKGFHPLAYLANYINIIEINSTFYRPPSLAMSIAWVKKVAFFPEFLFAVKLYQIFTHERKDFTQKDIDDFKLGIEPIRAQRRLAAILLQFPWSFSYNELNMDYLADLFRFFSSFPLAVEVRHASWDNPAFYELLSSYKVCFCNIDQPVFRNSLKPSVVSTTPQFAYVRLHGRNYRDWLREDAGRDDRYNYFYTKNELEEWVERIKRLGEKSERVFVITNNHYRGQALANALQIKNMISGEKLDIPLSLLRQYPVLNEIISELPGGQKDLFPPAKPSKKDMKEENTHGWEKKG